jgi:hypothetical protein
MRLSLQLLLQLQSVLLAICLLGVPHATRAQSSAQIPQQWNDAVNQLADKIAANISPLHPLALETKNISDLSSTDAATVRNALESELKSRSFHIVPPDSEAATAQSATKLQFTLSEGTSDYVLVAEIQNNSEQDGQPQIAIVAAPKSAPSAVVQPNDSLSLEKRLIYQQPAQFLDFALLSPEATGNPSLLAILQSDRLAYYRAQEGTWRFIQAIPIVPWRVRDRRGRIDNDRTHAYVGDVTCEGELARPDTMKCGQTGSAFNSSPVFIVGDRAGVGSPCENREAYLETGTGDWTQTDSIQGYESSGGQFSASGAPIATPGPVISFETGFATNTVRAVVYNLKTRNYEAYIVTATCSH